jgi:hypothetical protein
MGKGQARRETVDQDRVARRRASTLRGNLGGRTTVKAEYGVNGHIAALASSGPFSVQVSWYQVFFREKSVLEKILDADGNVRPRTSKYVPCHGTDGTFETVMYMCALHT